MRSGEINYIIICASLMHDPLLRTHSNIRGPSAASHIRGFSGIWLPGNLPNSGLLATGTSIQYLAAPSRVLTEAQ